MALTGTRVSRPDANAAQQAVRALAPAEERYGPLGNVKAAGG